MLFIHYDAATGEISNYGDGEISAPFRDGHAVAKLNDVHMHDVDPGLHKFDPEYGCIADKSAAERLAALRPHVDGLIRGELAGTDAMMAPDRPISEPLRALWQVYRQGLRDLSKRHEDAVEMIRAWPSRPDGADPTAHLRERLTLIEGKVAQ